MECPAGLHPTRTGALVDRESGAVIGHVGEVDTSLIESLAPSLRGRRLGVIDLDFDALADPTRALRRSELAEVPSRFPSAAFDLAFVTPRSVHASDLAHELISESELVDSVDLFDVYEDESLPEGTRSLAYSIRLSSKDRTLSESEVGSERERLIGRARELGAVLR